MRLILSLMILLFQTSAKADDFQTEAAQLVADLKASLMKNLTEKISSSGAVEAIPFCHANVKPIAKEAAKDRLLKFEFGRTSHKIRNPENAPKDWATSYLQAYQGKRKEELPQSFILHQLPNGKRVYMEPLFVEARCLLCHGEKISQNVSDKIKELYPKDVARDFKLGEFRGFIWVKEK
jgi:hypothetical protein